MGEKFSAAGKKGICADVQVYNSLRLASANAGGGGGGATKEANQRKKRVGLFKKRGHRCLQTDPGKDG